MPDSGRARAGRGERPSGRAAGDRPASRAGGERPARRGGARPSGARPPGTIRGDAGQGPGGKPGDKVRGATATAPDPIRAGPGRRIALVTSGLFGVSSTRRAAILAVVVCALALTVAVPLRNFLTQRQELSALEAKQRELAAQVDELTRRRNELSDPARVQAEARDRLGYVRPGEIPYVVQLPEDGAAAASTAAADRAPWFEVLWSDLRGVQR